MLWIDRKLAPFEMVLTKWANVVLPTHVSTHDMFPMDQPFRSAASL
jgi:hypothetical protein